MEDRYKFRAHFPDKKGIMQSKPIHYLKWFKQNELLAELITFETIDGSRANYDKDKIILMQCTGLKDKNGTLIFEGDILKYSGIVEWDNIQNRWSCIDIHWNNRRERHSLPYLTSPLEIIGNIHENPELLENNS